MGLNENIHRADQVKADQSEFTKNLLREGKDPRFIADLVRWFRSDYGITEAAGQITQWDDFATSGVENLSQVAGTHTPSYITGAINGLPVVRFVSSDYFSANSNPITPITDFTSFTVYKKTAVGNTMFGLIYRSGATHYITPVTFADKSDGTIACGTDGTIEYFEGGDNTSYSLLSTVVKSGLNNNEVYKNGVSLNRISSDTPASGPDTLTNMREFDGALPTGDIACILLYDRILTTEERQYVEAYLSEQYAIGYKPYMTTQEAYEIIDSWSPILHSDNANFYDSFVYGANATYTLGENWVITSGNGGSTAFAVDEVNHPGIFQFTTGTSVNGNGGINSFSDTIYLSEDMIFEAQVKCDIIESQDSVNWGVFHVGLGVDTGLFDAGCTDAVIFKVGGTTNGNEIVLSTRDGGSETETFTGVNMSNNTWYNLRWEYTGGLVKIYIDEVSTIDRDNLTFIDSVAIDIPTAAMKRRVGMQIGNGSVPVSYNGFIDHFLIEQPTIR